MGSSKQSPLWKVAGLMLPVVLIVGTIGIFIAGVIKAIMTPGPAANAEPAQVVHTVERDAGSKR